MADKLIVSNETALRAKYGPLLSNIKAAVDAWIAADAARGLTTAFISLDDAATMARYGVNAASVGDEAAHKSAFDAIFKAEKPSYAVLLGAPDVLPHVTLKNPVYNPAAPTDDPDVNVPSDLPYACDAPYSNEPSDFVGATRVVTRLPDINGASDPTALTAAIEYAGKAEKLAREDYAAQYLGATASVWHKSTSLSLTAVFGSSSAMKDVPPATFQWSSGELSSLSHFFNCHGADQDTHYYGQKGNQYPVAHDASFISGKLKVGVVLAAECCYGAQLFNPAATANQPGIANIYVKEGAVAVWGSTTIAYGPSDSNGQADLICQYFFDEILAGSSVGMAALRARQRFTSQASTLGPSDLKTLVQYIALGDASAQPVMNTPTYAQKTTPKAGAFLADTLAQESRYQRRVAAQQDGTIASLFRRRAAAESVESDEATRQEIVAFAVRYGILNPSITTKPVLEPAGPKLVPQLQEDKAVTNEPQRFHIVFEHLEASARFSPRRILEIGEANGRILTVAELFSR